MPSIPFGGITALDRHLGDGRYYVPEDYDLELDEFTNDLADHLRQMQEHLVKAHKLAVRWHARCQSESRRLPAGYAQAIIAAIEDAQTALTDAAPHGVEL